MSVLVGGIGALHDRLLAAALRGRGVDAIPLGAPGAADLATGRALLARGHCHPTYHLAGAAVERARAAGPGQHVYLTAGSCGPCRFATYPAEYRRALAGAGLDAVQVVTIDPSRPWPSSELAAAGVRLDGALIAALVHAVLAADVLVRAGCTHRARTGATNADAVEACLAHAASELAGRLTARAHLEAPLRRLGAALTALPPAARPPAARVRLTGQFFVSIIDGAGGRLVRWLEARGAAVEPPAVAEWLLYLLWQARQEPIYGPAGAATPPAARVRRHERGLRALHRSWATAAAATPAELPDMDDLAALAGADYAPALRGGMGHLEVALLARAARDRTADLVVSVKPFGCLPSSAISDAVARPLARRLGVELVAIETTGAEDVAVTSRLELALDRARTRRARLRADPS